MTAFLVSLLRLLPSEGVPAGAQLMASEDGAVLSNGKAAHNQGEEEPRVVKTADLCDKYDTEIRVAAPLFTSYGGLKAFHGPISTVRVADDNSLVRAALETSGEGRVLVVDGGASTRCALLGDQLAHLAVEHGWVGIIVHGCIRDSAEVHTMPLGVKALNTHPRKSIKRGLGERDVPVSFAGVTFVPGHFVYADEDGIVVAERDFLVA
eukprot:jgi/Chlat1/9234/Chrsp99S08510